MAYCNMMNRYRILVVEDDAPIRVGMVDALTASGYEVISASDGEEGKALALSEEYDLALLDVVLPGADGFSLLKTIRGDRSGLPVIMLTAKGEENDRVRGLKLGADEYVVKPFSIRELLARIEAVLRRSPERPRALAGIDLPEGRVCPHKRVVIFPDGREEQLTNKEFELLRHLAGHPGRIISREEIMSRVWNMDARLVESRSIDTTLARIREKLGKVNGEKIRTYRGRGYVWGDLE